MRRYIGIRQYNNLSYLRHHHRYINLDCYRLLRSQRSKAVLLKLLLPHR
jgi:hypothetical protein